MKDMLNNEINNTFTLYCDSQSAIALTKNTIHHQRSKYIDIRFHFIRNDLEKGTLKIISHSWRRKYSGYIHETREQIKK